MTDPTSADDVQNDPGMPAAVLWDMDGTLVDTEPYWMDAESELITEHGGTWTHTDALQVVGMGLWDAAAIFQSHGVGLPADEIVQRMTNRVLERIAIEVPWRPGARELLAELRGSGIPTALVTMSIHRMAQTVADAIGFDAFDVIVGGDDVDHAKPHPAPYLRAAELLGVPIERCIAIEDSRPGLASAVASGAVAIGVPLHLPLDAGATHTIWPTLDGVTVSQLAKLYVERNATRVAE